MFFEALWASSPKYQHSQRVRDAVVSRMITRSNNLVAEQAGERDEDFKFFNLLVFG